MWRILVTRSLQWVLACSGGLEANKLCCLSGAQMCAASTAWRDSTCSNGVLHALGNPGLQQVLGPCRGNTMVHR